MGATPPPPRFPLIKLAKKLKEYQKRESTFLDDFGALVVSIN